ncbi:unnamed protein product [Scytosiphon promiscuus]
MRMRFAAAYVAWTTMRHGLGRERLRERHQPWGSSNFCCNHRRRGLQRFPCSSGANSSGLYRPRLSTAINDSTADRVEQSHGDAFGKKVKFLEGVGLTPAEGHHFLETHPSFVKVDFETAAAGLLKEELGLSPHEVIKIILGRPKILGTPTRTLERQLSFYLDVFKLSKYELRTLVVKNPTILRLSVDNLRKKMCFFTEDLRLRPLQVKKVVNQSPNILGHSVEKKMRPNIAYLEGVLGIPRNNIKRVIVALPNLLSYNVDSNLKPKVEWLQANIMLRDDQLRKALTQHPQIFCLSIEDNLNPRIAWLRKSFCVSDMGLRDMVSKNPSILFYNPETGIKRKMNFFTDELGVPEAQVRKILIRSPILLSYSSDAMRKRVSYFEEGLELDADDISSFISRCPQVLGYGEDGMESKVVFLMQALHATRKEVICIVFKFPHVLNLSIEKNLRGKIDFFTNELEGSVDDVRGVISGSPALLGYSLTKRLARRVLVLRSAGVKINFTDHVWLVSSATPLRFSRWIERHVMREIGTESRVNSEVERRMKRYRALLQGLQ